jgi:hypothetical protein
VQIISTQKPRWLRDLVRFLPLRSQFVLSGNVRDLHIHEPAPGEITAVPLATILVDQLKGSGYQRIVTFDPVAGFRSIAAPGASAEAGDEFLRGLGLLPSNGAAQGGIDLLGSRLIKSTIQEQRRGRQRPGNFAPACRSGLRCA